MTDTPHLGLPLIEASQAQKHVTHNEAITLLDILVQLAVVSRGLTAPPSSPAEASRYIVKATGTGAFAGKNNQIARYSGGQWLFYPPSTGWLAWNGTAWVAAVSSAGDITALQNLTLLGVGAAADAANPFTAKLNNALWIAKTTGEGGDGTLRYKLSKENASKTLSLLFQDNFSGRAEIGLTGDDDLHFKVSPDGAAWIDALIIDKVTGAAKINSSFYLTGELSPAQIVADQNNYDPSGLSAASVLRLASDASRVITGLAGGADGRIVAILNAGNNNIVLSDASVSSTAANRFAFGADITLAAKQTILLWYDATDARWKSLAAPQAAGGGGGSGTVTSVGLALPAIFSVSGSPVTSAGTLTGTLATQGANAVWAGPASGAAASPSFRTLAGADLPLPASTTLGGVKSKAATASNWLNALGTDGALSASQPAFSDISGTAAIAQGGTGATTTSAARANLGLGSAATLDAGTTANKVVQLDGSARLPAVDGSQLTNLPGGGGGGGSAPADLDILLAELALGIADALNAGQFLGASGNRFADSFDALTYVDVAGASNLDSSVAGLLKPTLTWSVIAAQASAAVLGTMTHTTGAHPNNLRDQSTATAAADPSALTSATAMGYDFGSAKSVRRINTVTAKTAEFGAGNYWHNTTIMAIQYSDDNSSWTTVSGAQTTHTITGGNANNSNTTEFADNGAHRYWRLLYSSGATGSGAWMCDLNMYETATVSSLTVKSAALTAAAAPTSMKVVARSKHVDAITLNTDLIVAVSRDGGTTFNNATMNDRFTANALHVLESDAVNVSGQPSGTAVKWRLTTTNNKQVEIHDIYVYWT
jgi:Protein of unknown function (DUF2793)